LKISKLYSALFIAVLSALPWILFTTNTKLAAFAPVCLFIVFLVNDQLSFRYSKIVFVTFLFIFGLIMIRLGVVAQGPQSYRVPSRALLISVLPIIFLATHRRRPRNLIAINFIILMFGLVAIEGTLRVINPKVNEQTKWSEIKAQFDEAPTPEPSPDVPDSDRGRFTTDQPITAENRILFYGGSTTFNGEVSNTFTYASMTQRLFLSHLFSYLV